MSERRESRRTKKPYRAPRVRSLEMQELMSKLGPAQASAYVFDPAPLGIGAAGSEGLSKLYREI